MPDGIAAIRALTSEEKELLFESNVMIYDYGSRNLLDQAIIGVGESPGGSPVAVYASYRMVNCMLMDQWLEELGEHAEEAFEGWMNDLPEFDPSDDGLLEGWFTEEFVDERADHILDTREQIMMRHYDSAPMLAIEGPEPDADQERTFTFRGRRMLLADTGAEGLYGEDGD